MNQMNQQDFQQYFKSQIFFNQIKKNQKFYDSSDKSLNGVDIKSTSQIVSLNHFSNFTNIDFYLRKLFQPEAMNISNSQQIQQLLRLTQNHKITKQTKIQNQQIVKLKNQRNKKIFLNQKNQKNQKNQQIKKQMKQQFNFKQRFIHLSMQYHQKQLRKIQQKLLQMNNFRKCDNFASQLLILKINPTTNYEIVEIQMQLMSYKTTIYILNQLQQSYLHQCCQVQQSGSFGQIYFIYSEFQRLAVKCIQYKNKRVHQICQIQERVFQLKVILKEFFFLKLFSQLQIGPKIKKIMGFDIISTKQCVQFCTEICYQPNFQISQTKLSLIECLKIMHILKIAHRDIKPNNVMYSKTYKKAVFIDFGNCIVLFQPIGLKSLTNFAGTTGFCSEEMFKMIGKQKNYVDLYFNDLYGLVKTIIQPSKYESQLNGYSNTNKVQQNINKVINLYICLNKLKSYFYFQDEFKIQSFWRSFKVQYYEQMEQIQTKVLDFFMQIKPYKCVCKFYNNYLSGQIKRLPQFKSTGQRILSVPLDQFYCWNRQSVRQKLYQKQKSIYNILQLNSKKYYDLNRMHNDLNKQHNDLYQQLDDLNKQIIYLLLNKQFMINYVADKLSTNKNINFQMKDLIVICVALVHYFCLNKNSYKINMKQRLQKCQKIIKIIKIQFAQISGSLILAFKCQHGYLQALACFFQFFIKVIWKFVPSQYKQDCLIHSVSTLCLLGYPNYLLKAKRYLIFYFIKDESKQNKILYFWRCNLIMININLTYYNQNDQNFSYEFKENQCQEIMVQQKKLFEYENKQSKYYKTNKLLYDRIYLRNNFIYQTQIKYFNLHLRLQWQQQFNITKDRFQKWKQTIKLYLGTIQLKTFIHYKIQNIRIKQPHHLNFYIKQNDLIWPIVLNSYFKKFNVNNMEQVFNIFDENINFQSISFRYFIDARILIAFKNKNLRLIDRIITFLTKQLNLSLFQTLNIINKCLNSLFLILNFYLKQFQFNIQYFSKYTQSTYQLIKKGIQVISQINKINSKYVIDQIQQRKLKIGLNEIFSTIIIIIQLCYLIDLISFRNNHKFMNTQKFRQNQNQNINRRQFITQSLTLCLKNMKQNLRLADIMNECLIARNGITLFHFQNQLFFIRMGKQDRQNNFTYIIKQQFPNFTVSSLNDYDPETMPNFSLLLIYFSSQKESLDDQDWDYRFILLWNCLIHYDYTCIILQQQWLRDTFQSFIYLNSDYSTIEDFFIRITKFKLKQYHLIQLYDSFKITFMSMQNFSYRIFKNNCAIKFKIEELITYLANNISKSSDFQKRNVSLIYFFCLSNKQISQRAKNKFLSFIYKQLPFLSYHIKNMLLRQIYGHTKGLFDFLKESKQLKQNEKLLISLNPKPIRQKFKIDYSTIKRNFYFYEKHLKKNPQQKQSLKQIVEKRFIFKSFYLIKWDIPKKIQALYRKKLKLFHLVEQNCI